MEKKIRAIRLEPGKAPETVEVTNTVAVWQDLIGGWVEADKAFGGDVLVLCNEDGKLIGLPENRMIDGRMFVGTVFICGHTPTRFRSLTDEQVRKYSEMFAEPGKEGR